MYTTLSRTAALCVALVLFAPSLKVRFDLPDSVVLYVPTIVLAGLVVFCNLASTSTVPIRVRTAFAFAVLLGGPMFAFVSGGLIEIELIYRIAINCAVGALIVLFPWDRAALESVLTVSIGFGVLLALTTVLFYGSTGDLSGMDEEVRLGYLNITFSIGVACIACLHRTIERFNPLSLALFVVCWIGIAMSQGRGSLLFCALVSLLYILVVLRSSVSSFGRGRKVILIVLTIAMVPVVVGQVMKIERSAGRFALLFSDFDNTSAGGARLRLYSVAVDQIADSPVTGNGLGAYRIAKGRETHPHNIVLQYGVDAGLIGMLLLGVFLLLVARAMLYSVRAAGADSVNLAYAFAALFVYMFLSYMKSHDAYVGREMFVLSALPLALFASMRSTQLLARRRQGRVSRRSRRRGPMPASR